MFTPRNRSVLLFFAAALILVAANAGFSQTRDYLTAEEVELVRDRQQIDQRMEILTRAIDRRLVALGLTEAPAKKEKDEWGPTPTGTRSQLLEDIRSILRKAIDDIDNLSARPDSMVIDPDAEKEKKKPKGFSDLFPVAVRSLAASASRYEPIFQSALEKTTDKKETGILLDSIDMCQQITASVSKLPAEIKKAQK